MSARVLTFNELTSMPGQLVYEEWLYGTGTKLCRVISAVSDKMIAMERLTDGHRFNDKLADREFRFWSEEPTFEQQEVTDWRRAM